MEKSQDLLGFSCNDFKASALTSVETGSGHPDLTRFTIYPGLTWIGSREKRNCSFDDVETSKRYRVALS